MQFAVISDTHLDRPNKTLILEFENRLQSMDALLHCGDITGEDVYDFLNSHQAFYAVAGNMDMERWARDLPVKRVVNLGRIKVGIIHGFGLGPGRMSEELEKAFSGDDVNLICYGHTHFRDFKDLGGGLHRLNPGSFTLPKNSGPGYAVVRLQETIEVEWVDLA